MKFEYIPQIPVVLFTATLLGECWGLLAILLYMGFGLTNIYPVFALGGGFSYIFQYSFGYIFAYIFSVLLVAKQFKSGSSILNMVFALIYGVGIIHLIGIVYSVIVALIKQDSFDYIVNLIYYQSVSKIFYDLVFGFIAILLAKGARRFLWLIM